MVPHRVKETKNGHVRIQKMATAIMPNLGAGHAHLGKKGGTVLEHITKTSTDC